MNCSVQEVLLQAMPQMLIRIHVFVISFLMIIV